VGRDVATLHARSDHAGFDDLGRDGSLIRDGARERDAQPERSTRGRPDDPSTASLFARWYVRPAASVVVPNIMSGPRSE